MKKSLTDDMKPANEKLTGIQKAALIMVALNIDTASGIFKHLDEEKVRLISEEIARLKNVPAARLNETLQEFYEMFESNSNYIEGGMQIAEALLQKSLGVSKSGEILSIIKNNNDLKGFNMLSRADTSQLVKMLGKEHPQTIALILSHLDPSQTADILEEFSPELREDIAYRIATLGKISPDTLKIVESMIEEIAGISINQSFSTVGGAKNLAIILNKSAKNLSRELLEKLNERNSELADEVKKVMFVFDDILGIQDRDLQKVLKEIDRKDLATALKIADPKIKDKFLSNMSERAADLLKEEIEYMGKVKLKEVEAAQAKIINVIRSLEDTGEIVVTGTGGSEDVYV